MLVIGAANRTYLSKAQPLESKSITACLYIKNCNVCLVSSIYAAFAKFAKFEGIDKFELAVLENKHILLQLAKIKPKYPNN